MGIHESPTPKHWNYFLALEDDVGYLSRYLEPTEANFDAYSLELARILFAAASEVDVVAKQLCKQVAPESTANNIDQYRTELMAQRPQIAESQVSIPKFGLSLSLGALDAQPESCMVEGVQQGGARAPCALS